MIDDKTILIVEDEADARNYFEMVVRCLGYPAEIAEDGEEALACLEANRAISLVLLDLLMPRRDGLETLREMRNTGRNQPVIMLSGPATTTNVVQAIKAGATDFLAKPVSHEELRAAIRSALKDERTGVEDPPEPASEICLAESWMGKDTQAAWRRVAASDVPLLIEGETGSGKEVLARQVHANSPRAHKPFLKLNCAALPGELVESELFGYERGAFTGAFTSKPGKFELAQGGTILLDEIGDMDVRLQAKLLDIRLALPQRRHPDAHHVQPVVQIGAKPPRVHGFGQVAMGGGHHAHIQRNTVLAAQTLALLVLQHVSRPRYEPRPAVWHCALACAALGTRQLSNYQCKVVTLYGPIVTGFVHVPVWSWTLFWSVAVFCAVSVVVET